MQFLTGFESTKICDCSLDNYDLTRHSEVFADDFRLLHEAGLKLIRYSTPWHNIEPVEKQYDWRWMDAALKALDSYGIVPIVDFVHHASWPSWLTGGFLDPRFSDSLLRFVQTFTQRYPSIRQFTIINEPFVTSWFCGQEGLWPPYGRGDETFYRMIVAVAQAICLVSNFFLREIPGARLVHTEACEVHRARHEPSVRMANHLALRNELRFLVPDLIFGRVDTYHPLHSLLRRHGVQEADLRWLLENKSYFHVLALDYYSHCEREWNSREILWPNVYNQGFAEVATEYVRRLNTDVMLGETNIRGTVGERISWLKLMVEQCEVFERQLRGTSSSFHGFTWYPAIDCQGWSHMCRSLPDALDPQGIWSLDETSSWKSDARKQRRGTELSDIYTRLQKHEIDGAGIPAYRVPASLGLSGYSHLMKHWQWQ